MLPGNIYNYDGNDLLIELSESNEKDCRATISFVDERDVVLSIGQLGKIKLYWNNDLIFCGYSSRHADHLKFIVKAQKGYNHLRIVILDEGDKKVIAALVEDFECKSKGFFSIEYNKLLTDLYIANDLLLENGLVCFPSNATCVYSSVEVITYDLISNKNRRYNIKPYETLECLSYEAGILKVSYVYKVGNTRKTKSFYKIINHNSILVQLKNKYEGSLIFEKLYALFNSKEHLDEYQAKLFFELCDTLLYPNADNSIDFVQYKSAIDEQTNDYIIVKPKDFIPGNKYALVLNIATDYSSYEQGYFIYKTENIYTDVIVAMINIKGITMGAYIGETFFLEILNHIREYYNIDEDKIMLTGYSNGAYAVWTLAQHYPELFSSFSVLSGDGSLDLMCNIQHIPFIAIGSCMDYEFYNGHYSVCNCLDSMLCDNFITLQYAKHSAFYWYYCCESLIIWMKKQSNKNDNFIYKTKSKQHSDKYYFSIVESKVRNEYASVNIAFKNGLCFVTLENIKKIIFKMSRFIGSCSYIYVTWEDGIASFPISEDNLMLEVLGTDIKQYTKYIPYNTNKLNSSILEIYYKPVQIFTSMNDIELMTVAKNFSSPYSSGWKKQILVNYPIFDCADFVESCTTTNVIYITDNAKDPKIQKYFEDSELHLSNKTISYNGVKYHGDFIVTFTQEIPNTAYDILIIYATDTKIFKKSVFTRHLVLPSSINNITHPFDTKGFIFNGKNYFYLWSN